MPKPLQLEWYMRRNIVLNLEFCGHWEVFLHLIWNKLYVEFFSVGRYTIFMLVWKFPGFARINGIYSELILFLMCYMCWHLLEFLLKKKSKASLNDKITGYNEPKRFVSHLLTISCKQIIRLLIFYYVLFAFDQCDIRNIPEPKRIKTIIFLFLNYIRT